MVINQFNGVEIIYLGTKTKSNQMRSQFLGKNVRGQYIIHIYIFKHFVPDEQFAYNRAVQ